MTIPRVDVAVVTWNTRDLTVAALRRLVDADQQVDMRLLVHDNASTDGTADALATAVPEAQVHRGAANLGFAAGVNTLLERSDAPWVFLLNSDAWPQPGALRLLVDALHRHPEAAVAAPRVQTPDGLLEHTTLPLPGLAVAAVTGLGLTGAVPSGWAERRQLIGAWAHDRPRSVDWATGAALMLRRAAVDDVGGFDEALFMYAEDLEWCWRARRAGWDIWFEPAAVVHHVGNASGSRSFGPRRSAAYWLNTYRVVERRWSRPRVRAYRLLNAAGALRLSLAARRQRQPDAAHEWRSLVRVHLTAWHER